MALSHKPASFSALWTSAVACVTWLVDLRASRKGSAQHRGTLPVNLFISSGG